MDPLPRGVPLCQCRTAIKEIERAVSADLIVGHNGTKWPYTAATTQRLR